MSISGRVAAQPTLSNRAFGGSNIIDYVGSTQPNNGGQPVFPDKLQKQRSFLARQILGYQNAAEEKKGFFTYVMETTTFAGLPKVYFVPRWYLKVMWLLFFSVSFCYMGLMMMDLFKDYFTYPVKTDTVLGYSALSFPSITVCNENPIRKSMLGRSSCDLQYRLKVPSSKRSKFCGQLQNHPLVVEETEDTVKDDHGNRVECRNFDKACQHFMDHLNEKHKLDDGYSRRKKIKEEILSFQLSNVFWFGHQQKHFILRCSNSGNSCPLKKVTASLSSQYGTCFTWFPSKDDIAIGSGPNKGVELILNLETEEYIEEYTDGYGIQIIIHENNTVPLPDSVGMSISGGQETSIGLKLVNISRLGGKYGDCNDGEDFYRKYDIKYSEEACRLICLSEETNKLCDCYPAAAVEIEAFWSGDYRIYCRDYKTICAEMVEASMARNQTMRKKCGCVTPCRRMDYEKRVTSKMWPSDFHLIQLEKEACEKNKKSPKCNLYKHNSNLTARRSSFAKVYIFYETLNYENVVEAPFYTKTKFMSDLGGTMGLMIGLSLLSIAELIELLIEYIIMMCRTMRR